MRVKASVSLFWTALAVRLAPVFVAALIGFAVVGLDLLADSVSDEARPRPVASLLGGAVSRSLVAPLFGGAPGGPETARRRAKAPSEVRG